jgi:hypothetical protein
MIDTPSMMILIHLLIAHVIVDFVIQPDSWIKDKRDKKWRSNRLLTHSIIAGVLPLLLIGRLEFWYVFLLIGISHYFIDLGKCYFDDGIALFSIDQALHIVVVAISWLAISGTGLDVGTIPTYIGDLWNNYDASVVLLAALILLWPTGIVIGKLTQRWRERIKKGGLESAGKLIGFAERIIIFSLILVNQYTALGLIVATKSIFRMKEGSEEAEYYLVGSMLSFSAAIIMGLLVKQFFLSQ